MKVANTTDVIVEINVTIEKNTTNSPSAYVPDLSVNANLGVPAPAYLPEDYSGYAHIVFWFCFAFFAFLSTVIYLFSVRKSALRGQPFLAGHLLSASTAVTAACYFIMAAGEGKLYEPYAVQVAPCKQSSQNTASPQQR